MCIYVVYSMHIYYTHIDTCAVCVHTRVLCVLSRSVVSNSLQPVDCSPAGSSVHGDSPGTNTGVGCHALLQGIFPTQGSSLCAHICDTYTKRVMTMCGQCSKCINQCHSLHFTDVTIEVTEPGSGKASVEPMRLWLRLCVPHLLMEVVQSVSFNGMVNLVCWVLVLITTGRFELVVEVEVEGCGEWSFFCLFSCASTGKGEGNLRLICFNCLSRGTLLKVG